MSAPYLVTLAENHARARARGGNRRTFLPGVIWRAWRDHLRDLGRLHLPFGVDDQDSALVFEGVVITPKG